MTRNPKTAGAVRAALGEVLRPWLHGREQIGSLGELALSSVDYIQVARSISDRLGLEVSAGKLFMHPVLDDLSEVLAGLLGEPPAERADAAGGVDEQRGADDAREVAVMGMACQLPPDMQSPEEFWQALVEQRDCVSTIEAVRPWLVEQHLRDHDDVADLPMRAGITQRMDEFDAAFFGIAPFEAQSMDPQQRRLIEVVWHALEDAGLRPSSLRGSSVGVYVGAHLVDYNDVSSHVPGSADTYAGHLDSGLHPAMLANRISRLYDFHGPSMVVNTACSGSSVALHLAVRALRAREVDTAVVAGVNYIGSAKELMCNNLAGMQSKGGQCRTFDAAADGYVRSEGVTALVLRRLSDTNGSRVRAVILGTSSNHDGRTGSLRAPDPRAQAALVRRALADAGVTPDEVGMVECHGTGTPLGDPIEVEALVDALRHSGRRDEPVLLTSAKTVVGHLESAAGLVGVMKAVMCLEHETVTGLGHFRAINPQLDLGGGVVGLAERNSPWPQAPGRRRVACVSSFGFGGTNAHTVVTTAPRPDQPRTTIVGEVPLLLSARSRRALEERARQLYGLLEGMDRSELERQALALMAAEPMEHRLALGAGGAAGARERIGAFLRGASDGIFVGRAPRSDSVIRPSEEEEAHTALARLPGATDDLLRDWVEGRTTPWSAVDSASSPLPAYPFERQRHRLEASAVRATAPQRLHALVLRNSSDLTEQSFESAWDARMPVVRWHTLRRAACVPAAAWLEVARFCYAASVRGAGSGLMLEDVAWGEPMMLSRDAIRSTRTVLSSADQERVDLDVLDGQDGGVLFQASARPLRDDRPPVLGAPISAEGSATALDKELDALGAVRGGGYDCVTGLGEMPEHRTARFVTQPDFYGRGRNVSCDVYVSTRAIDLAWLALPHHADLEPLPTAARRIGVRGPVPAEGVIRARVSEDGVDVVLSGVSGQVAVWFQGIVFRLARGKEK